MQGQPDFYTRWEHGNYPVWLGDCVHGRKQVWMKRPDSDLESFPSARQFFLTLYDGRDHRLTMARYFRLGHSEPQGNTILDIFGSSALDAPTILVPPRKPLGIDLEKRGHEVSKLMYSLFGARIMRSGFDSREVLQEVYRGILARNRGICPYDPEKSSFSHYVHMVTSCVLNNYHKKEYRRRSREVDVDDTTLLLLNEAERVSEQTQIEDMRAATDLVTWIKSRYQGVTSLPRIHMACLVVPLMQQGYTRQEMVDQLAITKSQLNNTIKLIKAAAASWRHEIGV